VTPKVFTIPPHRAFADALAAGLIAQHGRTSTGLAAGRCFGAVHQGLWFDIGRPESIKKAEEIVATM
jgi:NDP-sugar pyrophosphorylase family protein